MSATYQAGTPVRFTFRHTGFVDGGVFASTRSVEEWTGLSQERLDTMDDEDVEDFIIDASQEWLTKQSTLSFSVVE